MNELKDLIFPLAIGLLLGGVFYGGLWFTVQKALGSKRPWLWTVSSFVIRMGVVVVGVILIGGTDWKRILTIMLGIIIARPIVGQLTKAKGNELETNKKQ